MKYIVNKSQYKLLMESLDKNPKESYFSSRFTRRLFPMLINVKDDLDWGVLDNITPCEFTMGEFVAEACDILKDIYIDSINDIKVSPKDIDNLFYYFIDEFSDYLTKVYKMRCAGGNLTEEKSDKVEKFLFDYLNSLDLTKQSYGITSFLFLQERATAEDYTFMVWSEDYLDSDSKLYSTRRLVMDPKLYNSIESMFGISEEQLKKLIIKWFNKTYNETAIDLN